MNHIYTHPKRKKKKFFHPFFLHITCTYIYIYTFIILRDDRGREFLFVIAPAFFVVYPLCFSSAAAVFFSHPLHGPLPSLRLRTPRTVFRLPSSPALCVRISSRGSLQKKKKKPQSSEITSSGSSTNIRYVDGVLVPVRFSKNKKTSPNLTDFGADSFPVVRNSSFLLYSGRRTYLLFFRPVPKSYFDMDPHDHGQIFGRR